MKQTILFLSTAASIALAACSGGSSSPTGPAALGQAGKTAAETGLQSAASCTKSQAEAVALRRFPGGRVLPGTHLEKEGGTTYWDVEVKAKNGTIWSVEVNANTCKIIAVDRS